MTIPFHFDYCRFVIHFETRECDASSFALAQNCQITFSLFYGYTGV
jgi:hypothetical protein